MSASRQRRSPKKSNRSSKSVIKATKATPKANKKSNRTSLQNKKLKKEIAEENPHCGSEMVSDKRRSKRLRNVKRKKEEKEEEEEEEENSDCDNDNNALKKKKRKRTNDDCTKSPPKKKARKTLKKKKNTKFSYVLDPSFTSNRELLLRIGIAYTKQQRSITRNNNNNKNKTERLPRLYYKSQTKYDNNVYKWHTNKKYKLLQILNHKIEKDISFVFKHYEPDRMWYNSINYAPIKRMLDDEHNNNNNNNNNSNNSNNSNNNNEIVLPMNGSNEQQEQQKNDDSDGILEYSGDNDNDNDAGNGNGNGNGNQDRPQVNFGKLLFKCKWEEWGDISWESWDKICETHVFKQYCKDKQWQDDELQITVLEHDDDDFKRIIENVRLYGNPTTRKALKLLINKELNVW